MRSEVEEVVESESDEVEMAGDVEVSHVTRPLLGFNRPLVASVVAITPISPPSSPPDHADHAPHDFNLRDCFTALHELLPTPGQQRRQQSQSQRLTSTLPPLSPPPAEHVLNLPQGIIKPRSASLPSSTTRVDRVRMHPLSLEFDDPEMESAYRVRAGEMGAVGAYSNAAIIAVHAAGLLGDKDVLGIGPTLGLWDADALREPCVLLWPRLLPITMSIAGVVSCNPAVASLCAPRAVREGDVTQRKLHQHAVIVRGGIFNMVFGCAAFTILNAGREEQRRAAGCVNGELLSAPVFTPTSVMFVYTFLCAVIVIEHVLAFPLSARQIINSTIVLVGCVVTVLDSKDWPATAGATPLSCAVMCVLLGELAGYLIERRMRSRFLATRSDARGEVSAQSPQKSQGIIELSELGLVDCKVEPASLNWSDQLLGNRSQGIVDLREMGMLVDSAPFGRRTHLSTSASPQQAPPLDLAPSSTPRRVRQATPSGGSSAAAITLSSDEDSEPAVSPELLRARRAAAAKAGGHVGGSASNVNGERSRLDPTPGSGGTGGGGMGGGGMGDIEHTLGGHEDRGVVDQCLLQLHEEETSWRVGMDIRLALDKMRLDAELDSKRAVDNAAADTTSDYDSSVSMSQSISGDDARVQ